MEVIVGKDGHLQNSTTGLSPQLEDLFTIVNHNIDNPYKQVKELSSALSTLSTINNLPIIFDDVKELVDTSELTDLNKKDLFDQDILATIDNFYTIYPEIVKDIEKIEKYRTSIFVYDYMDKEKLTVKQLKYILANPIAKEVLEDNIVTQVHNGAWVSDKFIDIKEEVDLVSMKVDCVRRELEEIFDEIYTFDYYDDLEDDLDDVEDDDLDDINDNLEDRLEELTDNFDILKKNYQELKEKYESLL